VVEEGALAALRSVRPGKRRKPSVPAEAHEVLLREKEEVEKALASLAVENQALKKAWRGGSRVVERDSVGSAAERGAFGDV